MIVRNPNRARCYRVSSSEGGDLYDVDLNALDGNGQCDCANFIFRMEDKVQRGAYGMACKHIIAARKYDLLMNGRRGHPARLVNEEGRG